MEYWYLLLTVPFLLYYIGRQNIKNTIVNHALNQMMTAQCVSENTFTVNPGRKTATITFDHLGQAHQIVVPFNRRLATAMHNYEVYIIKDDEKINITNFPGIPYNVTGNDLGADKVIINNIDDGTTISWSLDKTIVIPPQN